VTLPDTTLRRVQVLDIRIRLERLAVAGFDRACSPAAETRQSLIDQRLAFLIHSVPDHEIARVQGLIRLGRHVYAKSSDVMHGRTAMVNLPQVVIDEWRTIIEGLEALVHGPHQSEEPVAQLALGPVMRGAS
jgi:hypothetical protein